jgi:hypothetical protein
MASAWFKCATKFFSFANLQEWHQGQRGFKRDKPATRRTGDAGAEFPFNVKGDMPLRSASMPKWAIKRNKFELTISREMPSDADEVMTVVVELSDLSSAASTSSAALPSILIGIRY